MGYTTDFIGSVDVRPPLNHDEQQYLSAFQESRRFDRIGGPYEVPLNPAAENADGRTVEIERYNAIGRGQPSLWCGWVPALDGECLSFDGHEKFYRATEWMDYLIEHFLSPGALASTSGAPCFDGFSFDHVVNGVIAACRRDTNELYLIRVSGNVVTEEHLWPSTGTVDPRRRGVLPYQAEIDRWDRDT